MKNFSNSTPATKKIMRRIYLLYILRRLRSPLCSKTILLCLSSIFLSLLVSIPNIIANMPHTAQALPFIISAFVNTELIVQLVLICGGAAVILIIRDITILGRQLSYQQTRRASRV